MPLSPAWTEEIQDGSEERHKPFQTIVEEILAAIAEENVQPKEIEEVAPHSPQPKGSARSTDT